jgi:hypothetical protein
MTLINNNRKNARLFALFVILYLVMVFFIGWNPRGSDQYWSLSNVERVTDADGLYKTNNIFPVGMPEDLSQLPRPWVQNRPVIYLVSWVNFLFHHAQFSWLLCNSIFLLLSWLLMKSVMDKVSISERNKYFAYALIFLFPLNFYLSMQALPELFNQLLVMLLVAILLLTDSHIYKPLFSALVAGLLMYQRDNYILLIVLIPLYLFITNKRKYRGLQTIIFLVVMGLMAIMKNWLLPSHSVNHLSALSIIAEVGVKKHNMVNYLYADLPSRSIGELVDRLVYKTGNSIKKQFALNSAALFNYTINLLLIPFVLLLLRIKRMGSFQKRMIILTSIFVGIHIATIILFENQYRFSATLIPLLIICAAWQLQSVSFSKLAWIIPLILVIICVAADAGIAWSNIKEGREDRLSIAEYRDLKQKKIGDRTVMVMWADGKQLLPSYAWLPNYCYYYPPDAEAAQLINISKKLNTDLFLLKKPGKVYTALQPFIQEETVIHHAVKTVLVRIKR